MSNNEGRVFLNMSDGRRKIADKLCEEFTQYYNQHNVAWPTGAMSPENALLFRFFMEGCYRYGIEPIDENHFSFNLLKFNQEMEASK